jgi:outer membrane protein OmpA-like peptidoglycan-associated protein
MMIAALLALAAGAVAGIYLATRHFRRKRLPASVALFHGLGGATGFTLVLLAVVREPDFRPLREVLYLLIATVLLGAINLLFHIRKVRHRTTLILLHGFTAVTSAALLIRAILVYAPPAEATVAAATTPRKPALPSTAQSVEAPKAPVEAPAEPPAEPAPADEFMVEDSVQKALSRPIHFETGSETLRPSSLAAIADIARALQAHPQIRLVEIQGHADERGEETTNLELTRSRAATVVEALVAEGVARERLRGVGYGARCPADSACRQSDVPAFCRTHSQWQKDRRVVFVVLEVGKARFQGEVVCDRGADLIPEEHRRFHVPGAQ